jgi:hypothetical protein
MSKEIYIFDDKNRVHLHHTSSNMTKTFHLKPKKFYDRVIKFVFFACNLILISLKTFFLIRKLREERLHTQWSSLVISDLNWRNEQFLRAVTFETYFKCHQINEVFCFVHFHDLLLKASFFSLWSFFFIHYTIFYKNDGIFPIHILNIYFYINFFFFFRYILRSL